MKFLPLILILLLVSSCATQKLNCKGQCSLQGMVCAGTAIGTSHSNAYNFQTGQSVHGDKMAEVVTCREPLNEEEKYQVSKMRKKAVAFQSKESSLFWPKVIGTFLGVLILGGAL